MRLSPDEADLVRDAARREGLSTGAWVGEVAVRAARTEASPLPTTWRELVTALVQLRTEVVGGQAVPIVQLGPGSPWTVPICFDRSMPPPPSRWRHRGRAPGTGVRRGDHQGGARVAPGRPAGLLLGPGTAEVHRSPRIIATWDGLDAAWQPERTGPGEYDLRLKPMADALQAPAVAAGLATRAPAEGGRRGYVWHCSARLAQADRVLSDGQWAGIARELLDGASIAARDDPGGPRWVAVRHAGDHIHIAAVLVRQDTGRRFWPHHDHPKLRETARRIERRLGLTSTAEADRTAPPRPHRGELEKADRQGRTPTRPELRRAARLAAIEADGPEEFVAELRRMGYLAELRHAPSGDPLGHKLARPGGLTAGGEPVYSGSKLAPDLSLPQLCTRWAQGNGDGQVLPTDAEAVVRRARSALGSKAEVEGQDGVVHAAGDLLTVLGAAGPEGGRRWGPAAEAFDRAARPPGGRVPEPGPRAGNAGERDAAARSGPSGAPQRVQKGEMRMPHRPTAPEP